MRMTSGQLVVEIMTSRTTSIGDTPIRTVESEDLGSGECILICGLVHAI